MQHTHKMSFLPCIIIPCHNHAASLPKVLESLEKYSLPIFIVDDASEIPVSPNLRDEFPNLKIEIIRHEKNLGKGGAVLTALRAANKENFSHALQIDADGQHDSAALPEFFNTAQNEPSALISGHPIYDESVPRLRLYSRYLTHVWVWIETLSFQIKDSMCGLRVYPIKSTLEIADSTKIGLRMDFDTEIVVRLFWKKVPVKFIPVRVFYPENGISNFQPFRDNVRISIMHTRLVSLLLWGTLTKIISSIFPKKTQNKEKSTHWADVRERRGLLGMRFLLFIHQIFGRNVFKLFLRPIVAVYWMTAGAQRQASKTYLQHLQTFAKQRGTPIQEKLSSYKHFLHFGENLLEKLTVWRGGIPKDSVELVADENVRKHLQQKKGGIALCSHLGNFELCRAFATNDGFVTNAIFFQKNTANFNKLFGEFAAQSQLKILAISEFTAATAAMLQEKINAGEWVAIAADRISIENPNRASTVPFLGHDAPFPQGPFLLAAALKVPVFTMFALREKDGRKIYLEEFANPLEIPRTQRAEFLRAATQKFSERLEHYALRSPLDWANFFDFWATNNKPKSPQ